MIKKINFKFLLYLLVLLLYLAVACKIKVLFNYALIYFTIINGGIFLTSIFKKKVGTTISLSIIMIMMIMYVFGILHLLKYSIYVVLGLYNFLGIVSLIVLIVRKKIDFIRENIETKGLYLFSFIFLLFIKVCHNRYSSIWDEYTLWSIASKNMYILDDFLTNKNATVAGFNYPPFPTILQYFVCKLTSYSQGNELFASIILGISLLLQIFEKKREKIKDIGIAIVLIVIPTIFCETSLYESIYVDSILGIIIGVLIYNIAKFTFTKFNVFRLIALVMLLSMVKATGIVIVLIVLSSFIFIQIIKVFIEKKKISYIIKDKVIWFLVLLLIIGGLCFLSWTIFYKNNNVVNEYMKNDTEFVTYEGNPIIYVLKVIKYSVVSDNNIYNSEIVNQDVQSVYNLSNHLFEKKYYSSNPFNTSAGFWIILFGAFALYVYSKIDNKDIKEKFKYNTIAAFIGMILYIAFIQVAYILMFSGEEAVLHNSLQRYIGSYLCAIMIYLVYSYINNMDNRYIRNNKTRYCAIVIALLFFTPIEVLFNITITNGSYNGIEYRKIENDYAKASQISEVVNKDEKIYIIHQTGNQDTHGIRYRYCLTPIITSYYKLIDEKTDKQKIINDISKYDYVFVIHTDEYLNNNYNDLFEQDNIKELTLYKITKENEENIKLNPVNMEE